MDRLNLFNLTSKDFLSGDQCGFVTPDHPYVELAHSLVYTSPQLQSGEVRVNEREPVTAQGIFIVTGIQILVPTQIINATGLIHDETFTVHYSAVAKGAAGNGIQVNTVNSLGHNLPFSLVSIVAGVITVQCQTSGTGDPNGDPTTFANFLASTPAIAALITIGVVQGTLVDATAGSATSGGATVTEILYVRFQWPNGRYSSNIRIPHNLVYAPYQDVGPSLVSNSGIALPRPVRIEPVLCLPGSDIGIEVENRASLAQPAFAAMIEFRGRLRRFLKQTA